MLVAAAFLALAAPVAASEIPPERARIMAIVRIVRAADVRDGRTDLPHKRRPWRSPEGRPVTLLEFE
jgi:hypothetical protein